MYKSAIVAHFNKGRRKLSCKIFIIKTFSPLPKKKSVFMTKLLPNKLCKTFMNLVKTRTILL